VSRLSLCRYAQGRRVWQMPKKYKRMSAAAEVKKQKKLQSWQAKKAKGKDYKLKSLPLQFPSIAANQLRI
jgi:ribosomal protein S4E